MTDYWYRFELQSRGSPRVHGVLCLGNEPYINLNNFTEDDIQKLTEYFDKLCFAINPFAEHFETDYHTNFIHGFH